MRQLVILGVNFEDAHSEYRRLVEEEFERLFGTNVALRYVGYPSSIQGVRVDDIAYTARAAGHKNFGPVLAYLENQLNTTQNGDM